MNLINKAKEKVYVKPSKGMTDEEIQLAAAWLKDEVTLAQVSKVLELPNTSTYIFLARASKLYFKTLPEA